jgi:aminoglycoside phosphotransferase (APT) family kinase protein
MGETKPIRKGEEINESRLGAFLCSELNLTDDKIVVEQFPAGSSNLTYLVRSGSVEFVLRRPPFGNTVATAHDMGREFHVLSKLSKVYPQAPRPLIFVDDVTIIGSEFYLMERRRGLILRGSIRESIRTGMDARTLGNPAQNYGIHRAQHDLVTSQSFRRKVCESFVATLADLHRIDPAEAGLADLGKPEGYVRRQVEGWSKRYFAAKTDDVTKIETTIVWLNENIPIETSSCLIHNDYKFDNIILDPADLANVSAVLDWEMVTIGDPLMDLGTTLGYWMSKDAGEEMLSMPFNPRVMMENISRAELVEMYAKKVRRDLPDMLFYYIFGTFKIAVICQQIYARFLRGFTSDERFSGFDRIIARLGNFATRAIDTKKI